MSSPPAIGPAPRTLRPLVLFALLVLLCGGCAAGRVNLWPVYFHETRELSGPDGTRTVTSTDVLYPVFHRESDGSSTWHAVRPLYNAETQPDGELTVKYLWPLGLIHKRGETERHYRLFPLFAWLKTHVASADGNSVHAHLLQLIRWGSDARYGPYFAVFPLGGVTHNVIGPTWNFLLFPLYSYYRRGEYVRHDFPWPVLGFGRSSDNSRRMTRFWPFYVHRIEDSARGLYERHDRLWPLFRWGRLDPGGRYHHKVFVAVPFYSSILTYDREGELVAYVRSYLGVRFARDFREQKQRTGWGALWSLIYHKRTDSRDDLCIFPFYWRTTHSRGGPDSERRWTRYRVPWPIVWIDSDRLRDDVHKSGLIVAPFYWHFTDVTDPGGPDERTARRITLWPLSTWEQEADGARHLWVVSRGWRDPGGGYKRNYRDILDFFQYHHRTDGTRETRLLSRLYHHRRGPGGRYLSLMSLFTYDGTGEVVGESGSYVSALFGLIKVSWTPAGRRWRLFYIPLSGSGAKDGDAEPS
ncbi:MAG: hypothetical protein R6X33_01585 [Candidatus Brocadiia bacterium]